MRSAGIKGVAAARLSNSQVVRAGGWSAATALPSSDWYLQIFTLLFAPCSHCLSPSLQPVGSQWACVGTWSDLLPSLGAASGVPG